MTFKRLALLVSGLILAVLLQGEVMWPVSSRASPLLPGWTGPGAGSDAFAVTNVPTPTVSLDGGVIPGGYARPLALTLSGAPSETMVSFDLDLVIPPDTSRLYVTTTDSTAAGTYALTATGTSDGVTAAAHLTFTVDSNVLRFTLDVTPSTLTAEPGHAVTYTCSVIGVGGFDRPVRLLVDGLPSGAAATWSSNPVTPGHSSTLTVSTSVFSPPGRYMMPVAGIVETTIYMEIIELILEAPFNVYLPVIFK